MVKKINFQKIFAVIVIVVLLGIGLFVAYNASFSFQPMEIGEEVNPEDLTMTNQPWVNSVILLQLGELANYQQYPMIILGLILLGVCILIYQNSRKK